MLDRHHLLLATPGPTGPTGATGPQGPAGSAVNPRGPYAGGTTYAQFDGVTDASIAYISLQAGNTGHTPASNPTWWQNVGAAAQTPWAQNIDAAGFNLTHVSKVGAGSVTAPNGSLDTDGSLALRGASVPLSAGANNDVAIGNGSLIRTTASGAYNITGFAGGYDGRLVLLWNLSAQTLTIRHYNAGSTAANRFFNPSGADVVLRATANSFAGFIYDISLNAWILMFSN